MRAIAFTLLVAGVAAPIGAWKPPKPQGAEMVAGKTLWAAVSISDPVLDWDTLGWELGTRGPFMISFSLVNDGDKVIDPKITASRLIVNGKEFKGNDGLDWRAIVGSGLRDGRWEALPPSDYISFGYDMGGYFKEPGIYRVKWKGEGFEAPEVVFRVMPRKKADK